MNRDDAWAILSEQTSSATLLKHMLAVEAVMRAYARKFGEDEELWGVVGLLHDLDYERHPVAGGGPSVRRGRAASGPRGFGADLPRDSDARGLQRGPAGEPHGAGAATPRTSSPGS